MILIKFLAGVDIREQEIADIINSIEPLRTQLPNILMTEVVQGHRAFDFHLLRANSSSEKEPARFVAAHQVIRIEAPAKDKAQIELAELLKEAISNKHPRCHIIFGYHQCHLRPAIEVTEGKQPE